MADFTEEAYFPSCWHDDIKMNAYFSPLRNVNVEGELAKMKFWKSSISIFCQKSVKMTFTLNDIKEAFTRKGRSPQCMDIVIENMLKSKEIMEYNAFVHIKPINKTSWWELGKRPFWASWSILKNILLPSYQTEATYVHIKAVEQSAHDLLERADHLKGNVLTLDDLIEKCNLPKSSYENVMLTIYWLFCQNKASILNFDFSAPSKVYVKLASDTQNMPISETDIVKMNLKKLIEKAEVKIAEYEAKSQCAKEEARACMLRKSKILALSQLRKKKTYEEIISKEANILNNLHVLVETMSQLEGSQEIIEAMRAASAAIKNSQNESKLTEDTVLDVVDDLRNSIEMQEDINTALSQTVVSEDNEELEKELQNLVDNAGLEDDLCKWVEKLKLPDLPVPEMGSPKVLEVEKE